MLLYKADIEDILIGKRMFNSSESVIYHGK